MGIKIFDFFSGCGGTSKGFEQAGMEVVWAIDNDADAARTFRLNFPKSYFECADILAYSVENLRQFVEKERRAGHAILFSGCAPCQPYSKQNKQNDPNDARRRLLEEFGRFVEEYRPEFVFVENVPGLQQVSSDDEDTPFNKFVAQLEHEDRYKTNHSVIDARFYGVPQRRRRLVFIASRLDEIKIPSATHPNAASFITVKGAIGDLPELEQGEKHPDIPNHQAARLENITLERLKHTPEGGGRKDWPKELWLKCHADYDGHSDVYGRMYWDKPANCLTTKCVSISNGRYGHPSQDRAISAREAARLQTFPDEFIFEGTLRSAGKQIGNAVPPLLAKVFGENFLKHYREQQMESVNG